MLGKFLKFLQCVKTRVMRRNFKEKKINFFKFIWLDGGENNFLRFYK